MTQLILTRFFERAEAYFPDNQIVSRKADGELFKYTYRDYCRRVRRLASSLAGLGINSGDKVGTLAWNSYRHFELYFAVPCYGAVLHTINIRLTDEHIAYIINHAGDKVLFVDPDMLALVQRIAQQLTTVKHVIVMDDQVPEGDMTGAWAYEVLIKNGRDDFVFPELEETAPCGMCYTSATTGNPKGVVYSHRGQYLHALGVCSADGPAVSEYDTLLPLVPMFHVNSWGLPFAAVCTGAKMVFPGPSPSAADILDLIESEQVTFAAAAVTVGVQMLDALQLKRRDLSSLRRLMLGGQATPRVLMRRFWDDYGVPIYTAWGATETSPLATTAHVKRRLRDAGIEARLDVVSRQGIPLPGIELKVLDSDGKQVTWDDREVGEVYVRGPWVAESYYRDERSQDAFVDGWWKSGDLAAVDSDGVIRLVDRAKDLIKSGGEWISSVDLENHLMACPGIAEAAVVGAPHRRWQERPVAYVVWAAGAVVDEDALRRWLADRFAKWWLPDHYVFVAEIPKTGVGKFNKRALRERAASEFVDD